MKLVATDTSGTLGAVTLGDESAGDLFVEPPLPSEKRQTQFEALAFSQASPANLTLGRAFVYGRGNANVSFTWTVERQHATQTAAASFLWAHAPAVPNNCSLAVFTDDGTEHNFVSAVITEVTFLEWTNIRTRCRYSVEGAVPDAAHE
ncbi:MAG TPA: hypothetical protein VN829_13655 [Dongiaceae bacterium]|nr:hypothetical protein SBV1_900022 [Verrucomicrobiota bacterium]HXP61537.1 hypothetical protein [Dongiaceae bacterium]